eukprot:GHVU01013369.1.p2 GENE.GHVU01013369.1~~GHVU01013369.1.p2  ORF type:complete len:114 (-),score=9.04 GHVU01013369.1:335-676(-)
MYFAAIELMWTEDKLLDHGSMKGILTENIIKESNFPNTSRKAEWYKYVCEWVKRGEGQDKTYCEDDNRVVLMRGSDGIWLNLMRTDTSEIKKVPVKLEFLVLWRDGEWSLRGE